MLKRLIKISATLLAILVAGYLASLYLNNRNIPYPDRSELESAFKSGTGWLQTNRQTVLETRNPMLWWMLKYAGDVTADASLRELVDTYKRLYHSGKRRSPWYGLFYDNAWVPVQYDDIRHIYYYNKHAIAAMYCDRELLAIPEIAMQNDAAFCSSAGYWYRPACATHQLMGLRFLQEKNCPVPAQIDETVTAVQDRIHRQATLDPRVVDVYIQRVLMLVESGRREDVKPVWVRRILDHQADDGGWPGTMKIIDLPGSKTLSFSNSRLVANLHESNFHATAQGILLMALLMSGDSAQQ